MFIFSVQSDKSLTSSNSKDGVDRRNYIFPHVSIDDEYNKHELPPTENNEPVVVNVSILLSSIIKIDDPTQVKNYQTSCLNDSPTI